MSDEPLTKAELQKLDDGVYISEVRKNQAGVVVRTKEAADRSWKIAAIGAAVVFAAGFSDQLRESPVWVQIVGSTAMIAWLTTTGAFLWVNVTPDDEGHSKWAAATKHVQCSMKKEIADAQSDRVKERETYAKLNNRIAQRFHARRFRIATGWAVLALSLTAIAMVATVISNGETTTSGTLLLTEDGKVAVGGACSNLSPADVQGATVELDATKIGIDEPVKITFEPGVCASPRMHIFLDGELILGLVDP